MRPLFYCDASPRSCTLLVAQEGLPQEGDMAQIQLHPSLTVRRVLELANYGDECLGACIKCGADAWGVEPDARGYKCEECGENAVYGGEELVLELAMRA